MNKQLYYDCTDGSLWYDLDAPKFWAWLDDATDAEIESAIDLCYPQD